MAFLTRPASTTVSIGEVEGSHYEDALSEQEAIRFRQQAVEAQERAAAATDLIDKEAWLLIAEDWLKLARHDVDMPTTGSDRGLGACFPTR